MGAAKKRWRQVDLSGFRRRHGLSKSEAAKMVGVRPSTWMRWERSGRVPESTWRDLMSRFAGTGRQERVAYETGMLFCGAVPQDISDFGRAFEVLARLVGREAAARALARWHLEGLAERGESLSDADHALIRALMRWGGIDIPPSLT